MDTADGSFLCEELFVVIIFLFFIFIFVCFCCCAKPINNLNLTEEKIHENLR